MTDYECFSVTVSDKIAHIQLNRGSALNTMLASFWNDLPKIIWELSNAGEARVIVLSSTGKHFCAGMDFSVFASFGAMTDGEAGRANMARALLVRALQANLSSLEHARMPVLAAIQGGCIGGAVDLVCAADMRFATEDAYFKVEETNIGMAADVGTLQRLPKLIPDGIARELVYTGRKWSAAEAERWGFVNQVFPDQEAMIAGVFEIAAEIARKSPLTIWGTKEAMVHARDHGVADGLDRMSLWQSGALQPHDLMESFGAKSAKRQAEYPDLGPAPEGL